jgi:hypothetical protein
MRRFFLILGIALIVFSVVILVVFIIAPAVFTIDDAPFLKSIMQAAACNSGEELTAHYSTYSTPGTTTRMTALSCVNNEQQARDVSGQIIGIGAVGYLVPFLVGLFMSLLAGSQSKENRVRGTSTRSNFDNGTLSAFSDSRINAVTEGHIPLAQRLQELKDAYSAGLITEVEYKTKREALLNE